MSGVRNLRAMFEQKGDGNLPDRGRSPGPGGFGTPSPSASPRPLSKVRTAFVAIEKDGKIGLRREPSGDSVSVSSRRLSNDTDTTTPQLLSERTEIFSENLATNIISKMNLSHEPIPESPRQDTPEKLSPKRELQGPLLQPDTSPDKAADEGSQAEMPPNNATESGTAPNGTSSAQTTAKAPSAKPASKTAAAVSTTKVASRGRKTPPVSKAPSAKEPTKAVSSPANAKKTTATKAAAPKPAQIERPQSGAGFVKPKPKSPTRPVKLPSSLTTHTASSAQKLGGGNAAPPPRRSLSRASGSVQHLSPNRAMHRSPSRHSISTAGTTAKQLNRKTSSLNIARSRPSVGPPPKPTASDHPVVKKESHVDENFLARMTRPTQSSAKKTAEKVPASPPRKHIAPVKRPDAKDAVEKNAKIVPKVQAPATKAKTAKDSAKPGAAKAQPKAKVITAATATETTKPTAETTIPSPDTADAGSVKGDKTDTEAKPSAKDVAAIVTHKELTEATETTKSTSEASEISEPHAAPEPTVGTEMKANGSNDTEEPEPVVPVPADNEDHEVEDSAQEPSHQLHSTEPELESVPETNEPAPASEESATDGQPPVDEPAKLEDSVPNQEAKTEGPAPTVAPVDAANEDRAAEETNREAPVAAQ